MPTLLDQRSERRGPILFGRALVAAQQAEEDSVKNQIAAQRENRLAQREAQMDARQQKFLELQASQQRLKQQIFDAKVEAANMALKMDSVKVKQFQNASRAIGKLDPRSPDYEAQLGAIQADNPDIFADTGNNFTSILKATMETQQKARNEFIAGRAKEDEAAMKMEAETGIKVPRGEDGRPDLATARRFQTGLTQETAIREGLKPTKAETPGVTYGRPPDEERPIRQDRAFYATEAQRIRSLAGKATDPDIQKELLGRASEFESKASSMDQQLHGGTVQTPAPPSIDPERMKRLQELRGQYQPK